MHRLFSIFILLVFLFLPHTPNTSAQSVIYAPIITKLVVTTISHTTIRPGTPKFTVGWAYNIQSPQYTDSNHGSAQRLLMELVGTNSRTSTIQLGIVHSIYTRSASFDIPTVPVFPAATTTYKVRLTNMHDASFFAESDIIVTAERLCPAISTCGQYSVCDELTGQCVCDISRGYVISDGSCVAQCSFYSCLNGGICNPTTNPKQCTCPTNHTIGTNLIQYTGPRCEAITNTNICETNKICGSGGSQLFDWTKKCLDDCYCSNTNFWAKNPITKTCTVCHIQETNFCNVTHTNTLLSYDKNANCETCVCTGHFGGPDCSLPKLYISWYTGTTTVVPQNQPSLTPVRGGINPLSAEPSVSIPLLSATQTSQLTQILSDVLAHDIELIKIEQNDRTTSRLILSIAFQESLFSSPIEPPSTPSVPTATNPYYVTALDKNALNLRWLQFRKQLSQSVFTSSPLFRPNGPLFSAFPETMYDPTCPTRRTMLTVVEAAETTFSITSFTPPQDVKNTNLKINPYTYRCLYNQNPFIQSSGPLPDDYYKIVLINNDDTQPDVNRIRIQATQLAGPWMESHKTELIIAIIFTILAVVVVGLIVVYELRDHLIPRPELIRAGYQTKKELNVMHQEISEERGFPFYKQNTHKSLSQPKSSKPAIKMNHMTH